MQSKQTVSLRQYKELIETIAKVEYQKLSAGHLIEYLELVNKIKSAFDLYVLNSVKAVAVIGVLTPKTVLFNKVFWFLVYKILCIK